jgi:hypothetical protein
MVEAVPVDSFSQRLSSIDSALDIVVHAQSTHARIIDRWLGQDFIFLAVGSQLALKPHSCSQAFPLAAIRERNAIHPVRLSALTAWPFAGPVMPVILTVGTAPSGRIKSSLLNYSRPLADF